MQTPSEIETKQNVHSSTNRMISYRGTWAQGSMVSEFPSVSMIVYIIWIISGGRRGADVAGVRLYIMSGRGGIYNRWSARPQVYNIAQGLYNIQASLFFSRWVFPCEMVSFFAGCLKLVLSMNWLCRSAYQTPSRRLPSNKGVITFYLRDFPKITKWRKTLYIRRIIDICLIESTRGGGSQF